MYEVCSSEYQNEIQLGRRVEGGSHYVMQCVNSGVHEFEEVDEQEEQISRSFFSRPRECLSTEGVVGGDLLELEQFMTLLVLLVQASV
jgi:hypothetical protein